MIIEADCIRAMKHFPENYFDALVTDPPYNLHFMGKDWDKDLIHEKWLKEAFRIVKPGASILVMGGTRTFHRLTCAIEDSGFIIKDCLMWLYGQGFPKAQDITIYIDAKILGISTKEVRKKRKIIGKKLDVGSGKPVSYKQVKSGSGKNIHEGWDRPWKKSDSYCEQLTYITEPLTPEAKEWEGFKAGGLKPAYEPIIWAFRPSEGSCVDNVLKWEIGAVNVDECRIDTEHKQNRITNSNQSIYGGNALFKSKTIQTTSRDSNLKGRFPANVILDEEAGRLLDEQSGESKGGTRQQQIKKLRGHGVGENIIEGMTTAPVDYPDSGGASRFFYCAKASRGERNAGLEGMEEKQVNDGRNKLPDNAYQRGKSWRTNTHPTVKPIKLFEYLIKLVTKEKQVILDPFLGSGTTMIAANNVNRICVGIEKEKEYCKIAKKRVRYWKKK